MSQFQWLLRSRQAAQSNNKPAFVAGLLLLIRLREMRARDYASLERAMSDV
jgi:hypothetical protein